jgi:ABC-type Co2+ transport system permease subunit
MSPRATAMLAIFFGPLACAADQLFSYMLVYPAAASGDKTMLHVLTAIAAVIAATGVLVSYRILRRKTEVFEVDRFLALFGIVMNAFFLAVVVFGFGIPKLLLHPTD